MRRAAVRGILCHSCNMFVRDRARMENAMKYVDAWEEKTRKRDAS